MSCQRFRDYGFDRPMFPQMTHPFGTDPVSSMVPFIKDTTQITELKEGSGRSSHLTLPDIIGRRHYPSLIANELVSVQPMSLPSGLLFYMDYRYEGRSAGSFIRPPGPQDTFSIQEACISSIQRPSLIITVDHSRFPHLCPRCAAPAYIGLMNVECSREGCR